MTCKPGEHAFLILAYRCDKTLDVLLRMLDDVRNDAFVRMDAKCRDYELDYCAQHSLSMLRFTQPLGEA